MNLIQKIISVLKLPVAKIYEKRYQKPEIMTDSQTVETILEKHCSISRFGDGELYLMLGKGIKFQKKDRTLSRKLKEIIADGSCDRCLKCIPYHVNKSYSELQRHYTAESFEWMRKHLRYFRGFWYKFCSNQTVWGDAFVSRFYMDRADKQVGEYISKLKQLWEGRSVVFVEGDNSCLGVGNDLFSNALTIRRIVTLSQNAWSVYDKIIQTVKSLCTEQDLIICAIGPTATVLSFELSKEGYQTLDLGHIDIEYEWFKKGATNKVAISQKAVAEVTNAVETQQDLTYINQIIASVR